MRRRRRRNNLKAFLNGFMLAGLPVAAFLAVDYLIAPPTSGSGRAAAAQTETVIERVARLAGFGDSRAGNLALTSGARASASAAASGTAGSGHTGPAPTADASGRTLVASIQHELQRVGCYEGSVDGIWSDRTRVAMAAFNTSVRISLPTDNPDYILLTLLQGHSAKACARACDTYGTSACLSRPIEARVSEPRLPTVTASTPRVPPRQVLATSGESRPSSVTVAAPILSEPALSEPTLAEPQPRSVSVRARRSGEAWQATSTAAAGGPEPAPTPAARASWDLPGRMAVGAPPATEPMARLAPIETAPAPAPRPVARERSVGESTANRARRAQAQQRPSRLSRTFVDINRSAP